MIAGANLRKTEEGGLEETYKHKDWVELRRRLTSRLTVASTVAKLEHGPFRHCLMTSLFPKMVAVDMSMSISARWPKLQ